MSQRSVSGRGGRRDFRGKGDALNRNRGAFTKLIKDKNARVSNIHQAKRFVEGMATFDSKSELLSKLDDGRNMGMQRIRDVLSWVNSLDDVEILLIPMLQHVMDDETARPLYRPLRNKILIAIYNVPGLMDALVQHQIAEEVETTSAEVLSAFLLAIAKAFLEVRMSDTVLQMAKSLRARGDTADANILCTIILADEDPSDHFEVESEALPMGSAACWVTDTIPPGGRHDNDHRNYRNIKIVPTVDELRCSAKPWLPLASGENHVIEDEGIRLLDGNFRLLREDAVNTMKENIAAQTKPWRNARVIGLDMGGKGTRGGELSFIVQCDSRSGGDPNWQRSRALMHGSVVAFCRDEVPVRLGIITVREHEVRGEWLNAPGGPKFGVVFDSETDFDDSLEEMLRNSSLNESICHLRATMTSNDSSPTDERHDRIKKAMDELVTYDIIEASKSFFSYQPILRTLQSMEGVPLKNYLVGLDSPVTVRPSYLPETIVLPDDENFGAYSFQADNLSSDDLAENTSLDVSQAEAVKHTLSSQVSLIQGPPGTGKTFIGALIARVIRSNTNESILCVCYTNHALDQFLEHMLEAGETRIVRIGGRSKSERISKYQLKELSRHKTGLDPGDTRRLKQVDAQLYKQRELIEERIEPIKAPVNWDSPFGGIKELLAYDYPDIFEHLRVPVLDDGFEILGADGKKLRGDFLWKCWRNGDSFPRWLLPYIHNEDPTDFQSFWNNPLHSRLAMIETWRREILSAEMESLHEIAVTFNALIQERKAILQGKDLQVLREARIIGATTTGAAQYRDLLSAKNAGVVIVEEAGEVLEAHVLTSLSEGTQYSTDTKHLILIGDHKQLRPKVENYQLTTVSGGGYNLDCSLFERLVLSDHPSVALQVQHRMRPAISEIIRTQTYPFLQDDKSVHLYPDVKGVASNVVFIDHGFPEDGEEDDQHENMKTKSNMYEAELCTEIVRYILLQGYSSDRIVVLTPYLGQLFEIVHLVKSRLKEAIAYVSEHDQQDLENLDDDMSSMDFTSAPVSQKSVRCSSVDNFQGEEADIVIVSLVRSNVQGNIGFLKEEQRVNVLLSRARHGMFLVGNSATLLHSNNGYKVWNPIISMLGEAGRLLKGLPTCCQLHPNDEVLELCAPSQFRTMRPNGGCDRPCTFRMQCGHVCPLACHPLDRVHELAQKECCEPCRRFPPECHLGHPCKKLCKDDCGICLVKVGAVVLACGHVINDAICHEVRSDEALNVLSRRCRSTVTHTFQPCGHEVETTCGNARCTTPVCPATCDQIALCGHPCANKCGTCDNGHHCNKQCETTLFCGHVCGRPCHQPNACMPCEKSCSVVCAHSKCPKPCNAPCSSCVEPCSWACEHEGECRLVCGAPCSRLPCDERCNKVLECGHRCPSVCGEPCPARRFCRECASPEVKACVVDMICFETYEEHDIDADPIVCLPCGHIYSISTLDGHLGFSEVYTKESERWTATKSLRTASIYEKPKCCPNCRAGIHSVQRYGRLLRLIELRSLERKHLMAIDQALDTLSRPGVKDLTRRLTELIETIKRSPMRMVYEACKASPDVEVPPPPARPLIRSLQLLGRAYEEKIEAEGDECYVHAKETYERAIYVAVNSRSIHSGALLRISLATLLLRWNQGAASVETEAFQHLDWVIGHAEIFPDLVTRAQDIKRECKEALAEAIAAMEVVVEGYNEGYSWSSHWYQCPNGHPYFIGECGRAMEQSRCLDCGELVGGSDHNLLSTNRGAGEFVDSIRRPNR